MTCVIGGCSNLATHYIAYGCLEGHTYLNRMCWTCITNFFIKQKTTLVCGQKHQIADMIYKAVNGNGDTYDIKGKLL